MKNNLKLLVLGLVISGFGFARPLDTPHKADLVKESIQDKITSINGVNGIGITGCNPKTGEQDVFGDFVHCITVMTETQEAYDHLIGLYPVGTKIGKIFITIELVGEIVPQPNGTGGN